MSSKRKAIQMVCFVSPFGYVNEVWNKTLSLSINMYFYYIPTGTLYVNNIDLHITANYTNSTYKSCSQVSYAVLHALFMIAVQQIHQKNRTNAERCNEFCVYI